MGGLLQRGGTILGTANRGRFVAKVGHGEAHSIPIDVLDGAKEGCRELALSALVAIGEKEQDTHVVVVPTTRSGRDLARPLRRERASGLSAGRLVVRSEARRGGEERGADSWASGGRRSGAVTEDAGSPVSALGLVAVGAGAVELNAVHAADHREEALAVGADRLEPVLAADPQPLQGPRGAVGERRFRRGSG